MTVRENEKAIEALTKVADKLTAAVFGNGHRGMDEIVRDIEKRLGIVESELSHFRRVYFANEGLDAMGNKKKQTFWEKVTANISDKLITAFVIAIVLVLLSNFPELIDAFIHALK